jgi:aromatic amino acid aminotransferase I / 2-aminoadipate transaminase
VRTKDILTIEEEIFLASIEEGVLLCRGSWFAAERDYVPTQMFFRATFAAASADKMTEAIVRFGVAVREAFKLK